MRVTAAKPATRIPRIPKRRSPALASAPNAAPAPRPVSPPPRPDSFLASWGRVVHRRRRVVFVLSVLALGGTIALLATGAELQPYKPPTVTESGRALELLADELPVAPDAIFFLVFSHPDLESDDPAYETAVQAALAPIQGDERLAQLITPYEASPDLARSMVSHDGHKILVVGAVHGAETVARENYVALRAEIHSPTLEIRGTGNAAIHQDIESILAEDLAKGETFALPFVAVLLLIVFGTFMAALLPLAIGVLAVGGGVALTFVLAQFVDVSVYATNVVTLVGLGVVIDYSLFIVSRFREELRQGHDTEAALARTLATAGRAVAFSGLTVAVGLSGMAFFTGLFIVTMGVAGAIVVAVAVLYALTLLPSILSLLGPRINKARVPFIHPERASTATGFWHRLAIGVMKRPTLVLVPALSLILLMGVPLLALHTAGGGPHALPAYAESRQGFEALANDFPGQGGTTLRVVADFTDGNVLSAGHVSGLYDYGQRLATLDDVAGIDSVVSLDTALTQQDYVDLYASPRAEWPTGVQDLVVRTTGAHIVEFTVHAHLDPTGNAARDLTVAIRSLTPPPGADVLVTGQPAIDHDTLQIIEDKTPWAVLYIVTATYVLLFLQTRSLLLPLKAVVMNFLSIVAAFGLVVWIFQQGYLSDALDFTPGPIDPSTLILLFANMFGLSMDYEVLMLARMHEEWNRTHDNRAAVAWGLEKSGRLITSAAAIMVLVFAAFAFGDVVFIKAFGLGLALAILIDATIVRGLIVPAAMRLMGRWNWWAPAWMGGTARRPAAVPTAALVRAAAAPRVVVATAPSRKVDTSPAAANQTGTR